MPSNKRSVYLTDETLTALEHDASLSGRLNAIVERYDRIVRESMPEFTKEQWCAIFDANNGTIFDQWSATMAWANVADSPELGEKWEIDQAALIAKMQKLSVPQGIAMVEAIGKFWLHHELPTDEAIRLSGARLPDPEKEKANTAAYAEGKRRQDENPPEVVKRLKAIKESRK